MDDWLLVDQYLATGDQGAFRAIVDAHLSLVYNVARREFGGNAGYAEDVAQTVFLLLAQKGGTIRRHKSLVAWLYQTARYCCMNLRRMEARRARQEREAAMNARTEIRREDVDFELPELLKEGLARLSRTDRDAIVIRYMSGLETHSLGQVAAVLGISRDAAEKRVARALEKLRAYLVRRAGNEGGGPAGAARITAMLAGQCVIAPRNLAGMVTSVATNGGFATPGARALVVAVTKSATAMHLKAAAILAAASVAVGGAGLATWHFVAAPRAAIGATASAATLPASDAVGDFMPGATSNTTYVADRKRNVFLTGVFNGSKNEIPAGWTAEVDPFALGVASYHSPHIIETGEVNTRFCAINLKSGSLGKKIELHTTLALKPEWKILAVRATISTDGKDVLVMGDSAGAAAGVIFTFLDKDNVAVGPGILLDPSPVARGFYKLRLATMAVPAEAVTLGVSIRMSDAKGSVGIGELVVMPVDEKIDAPPALVTALHTAIKNGNVAKVETMIGADKRLLESRNMQWDSATPLVGAAWVGQAEVVRTLVKLGADLKGKDDNGDGWTAAQTAGWWGWENCLEILVPAGAEDPQQIMQLVNAGQKQHKTSVPEERYVACREYLEKVIAATQPGGQGVGQ